MTLAIFQGHQTVSHQISRKRCVTRQKLLQSTNRKSYTSFRLVPFWWPWSTFEGHLSLGCHFHIHFSNHWQAFASRGLPAIAELLILFLLPSREPRFQLQSELHNLDKGGNILRHTAADFQNLGSLAANRCTITDLQWRASSKRSSFLQTYKFHTNHENAIYFVIFGGKGRYDPE